MRRETPVDAPSPAIGPSSETAPTTGDSERYREAIDALERVREQLAETQRTLDEFVTRIRVTEPADRDDAPPGRGPAR